MREMMPLVALLANAVLIVLAAFVMNLIFKPAHKNKPTKRRKDVSAREAEASLEKLGQFIKQH